MKDLRLGVRGERVAERYLVSRGYEIIERQWRIRQGEIDLIARKDGEVVFVEVKTRRGLMFGSPEDAVTATKQARLRLAAWTYLEVSGLIDTPFRIDVIGIVWNQRGCITLRHLRNAVGAS